MAYGATAERGHPNPAEKQGVHPSFEKTKVCELLSKSLRKCSSTLQQREESVSRRPATRGLLDRLLFPSGHRKTRGPAGRVRRPSSFLPLLPAEVIAAAKDQEKPEDCCEDDRVACEHQGTSPPLDLGR